MKKFRTLFVGLLIISSTSYAQKQADSATQFKSCTEIVNYSVNDILLKERVGQSLLVPQTNPSFKGGVAELKGYFASHALNDAKAKDIVFRVHIGFLVNCSGQAGNFQIISKGKGDLQLLAEQVLVIVKEMPQNWQSALADDKTVDCYQVLSFTIVRGALDKVSYR